MVQALAEGLGLEFRPRQSPHRVVRRRQAQRFLQLPRPPSREARQPDRHPLGGDDPQQDRKISYRELYEDVCRFANALKSRGVKKGDRVCIYMPMIPETVVAMLACARIGAVHSVVFGGFSPSSLTDRILDSDCRVVVTADEGVRGGKKVPLKKNTDEAVGRCPNVHTVLVVKHTGGAIAWKDGRDVWYHELMAKAPADCPPEEMDAEAPLFILYTSGSTGKPKGSFTPPAATSSSSQ